MLITALSSLVIVPVPVSVAPLPSNVTARPPSARLLNSNFSVSFNSTLLSAVVPTGIENRRGRTGREQLHAGRTQRRVVAVSRGRRAVLRGPIRGERHVHRVAERDREAQIRAFGCRRRVDADHRIVVVGDRAGTGQRGPAALERHRAAAVGQIAQDQTQRFIQLHLAVGGGADRNCKCRGRTGREQLYIGRAERRVVAVSRGRRAVLCNPVHRERHVDRVADRDREIKGRAFGCRRTVDADHRAVVIGDRAGAGQRGTGTVERHRTAAVSQVTQDQTQRLIQLHLAVCGRANRNRERRGRTGSEQLYVGRTERRVVAVPRGRRAVLCNSIRGERNVHGTAERH